MIWYEISISIFIFHVSKSLVARILIFLFTDGAIKSQVLHFPSSVILYVLYNPYHDRGLYFSLGRLLHWDVKRFLNYHTWFEKAPLAYSLLNLLFCWSFAGRARLDLDLCISSQNREEGSPKFIERTRYLSIFLSLCLFLSSLHSNADDHMYADVWNLWTLARGEGKSKKEEKRKKRKGKKHAMYLRYYCIVFIHTYICDTKLKNFAN